MRTSRLWLLVIILLMAAAFGCSGGPTVTPDPTGQEELNSLPTVSTSGSSEYNSGMLGVYNITLDPTNVTGTIDPIRTTASADVLESVDITGFMTGSPCIDCAKIVGVALNSDGHIIMKLGIKHPFGVADPAKPITAKNRADIQVFNVEGMILSDQPKVITFPDEYKDYATGYLVNPDGYSLYQDAYLDDIYLTGSDLHPYILHFDDYSTGNFSTSNPNGFADPLHPTGNLVMAMGSDYSVKDYEFDIPMGGTFNFAFAIGCTYGFTTTNFTERLNPVYRLPQHNKKAASEVHVEVISNDLEINQLTTSATFKIEIMDINASAEVGDGLDQMLYESDVQSITVEIPGLCYETFDDPEPISGDGRTAPLVFEVTVHNDLNNSGTGQQPCLIKIRDAYPARQNPNPVLGRNDAMGRGENRKLEPFQLIDFSTYQFLTLEVKSCPPVGLRAGVNPIDIAVDGMGRPLIAYSDNQIWRYDYNYCSAQYLYTVVFDYVGPVIHIDAQQDGRSIAVNLNCPT